MSESTEMTPAARYNAIKHALELHKGQIEQAAGTYMTADRVTAIVLGAIQRNPQLLECTELSILKATRDGVSMGLEPGSLLGEFYLVPFRNSKTGKREATGIPGYRGLIALARRTGEIANIYAESVYSCDVFEVERGLKPNLIHKPNYADERRDDPNNITFVYAVCQFKDGSTQFEVMSRNAIEKIRAKSKAANYGPWVDYFEEMAKKTVIRRLSKYLPMTTQMTKAIAMQERAETGTFEEPIIDEADVEIETVIREKPPDPTKGTEGAKATIKNSTKKPTEPQVDTRIVEARHKLTKAYEAIEIMNDDEREADFARRTGGTMLDDATVAEIQAVTAAINAEFDKRNA